MKADRDSSQETSTDSAKAGSRATETGASQGSGGSQAHPGEERYTGLELWLHRLTVMMLVFVCAVVGVLLVIFPWRPEWTDNRLLLMYPGLRAIVTSGFVRGVCSGLGLLDIWIGFWEAMHYHEVKQPHSKS